MTNHFQINDIIDHKKSILSLDNTASLLGISKETVRHWVRSGYLPLYSQNKGYTFHRKDIEDVRTQILNGKIKKLDKRANKSKTKKTFIPEEHINNLDDLDKITQIIYFIKENNISILLALFLMALNFLRRKNILLKTNIHDVIQKQNLCFSHQQIQKEIHAWHLEIKKEDIKEHFSFLLGCDMPEHQDILGILYQSLLCEGEKSTSGSYYTPSSIVHNIVKDYVKSDSKVFDPACGTGQFLLAYSNIVKNPLNVYGMDIDKIAVKIARLNILTKFKHKNFVPNIFCKNTLFDVGCLNLFNIHNSKLHQNVKNFDIIATNPPWGVHFSKEEIKELKYFYPQITSLESFSYFLKKSLDLLSDSGTLSFILPEAILNVKIHRDIRQIILKQTQIKKIIYLNRVFKNVFTPVIRMDLKRICKKSLITKNQTIIENQNKKYKVQSTKWINNHHFIFNIHANKMDYEIIDKVYKVKHTTLKNKAVWALGIVTGNNDAFMTNKNQYGFEPIYRGRDVKRFVLDKPSCYIQFNPDKFQQVASEFKYRSKEKLIYKFISRKMIFAYDDCQSLTLNSANIVIPCISNYPIKAIAALLNSSVYQLIFQKKYSSIKVLRSHIEEMPLPLWDIQILSHITKLVDKVITSSHHFSELDDYIMSHFMFSQTEKKYIKTFGE